MVKKLISFDDQAADTGLPVPVQQRLDDRYLTDGGGTGVVLLTADDFTPELGSTTYSTVTVPTDTMKTLYVRGSTQSSSTPVPVTLLTGHRADGTTAVITQSGLDTIVNNDVATIAAVFQIAAEFTSVTVRLYNTSHAKYQPDFTPLVVVGVSVSQIADTLRKHDGAARQTTFPRPRHAWSGATTYNTGVAFVYPGAELEYQVNAVGTGGAFFEWGKPYVDLTATGGTRSFDTFGFVGLSTYNTYHTNYTPGFDAYYRIVPDEVEATPGTGAAPAIIAGAYLPTPTLKAVRHASFTDGTSKTAIQHLWHDHRGVFYISSSLHGDKKKIFTYDPADFHGAPVERWSMNFDKYGNIVCVFRTEQLSWAVADNNLRRNPVVLLKDEGYRPQVINFGTALKPSAWLQDSGYLWTEDYVMLTEYTRPNSPTANTWRITYPVTDPANWQVVQSWPVTDTFKHIHMVDRDPYTGHIYTSTGDVDAAAGIYASTDQGQTFTTVLDGSEKHCRVLNFVFMKDWIYWATDSRGPLHWLFRAPRDSNGVMDATAIEELTMFPTDSEPTYATIHLPKIDALLFLNRADGNTTALAVDLWDLRDGRMIRLDSIPAVGGVPAPMGFRCETFTYVPRGNEVAVGFSNTPGEGGYMSRLGLLGNTTSASAKVQNLIMTVGRIPGATGDGFTISYDTSVI